MNRVATLALSATFFAGALLAQSTKPCESLKSLSVPDATITAAESVPAGPYQAPGRGGPGAAQPPLMLPAYCRVAAVLTPSSDSHIEIELWMPEADWNGKFEAVGNGGFVGAIGYPAMAAALREGYATAGSDTGHKGNSASFALGHPER